MINHPTKPQNLFTVEEIAAQIKSGEYSAELLLMHLSHHFDNMLEHIKNTPCPQSGAAPYFTSQQWEYARNRFLNK
jgi:hypothetical protein